MAETMRCYRHPNRETRVSCATCDRPICTECMVQTDVGIKCPDDARLPRGARAGVMKGAQVVRSLLAGVRKVLDLERRIATLESENGRLREEIEERKREHGRTVAEVHRSYKRELVLAPRGELSRSEGAGSRREDRKGTL